MLKTFSITDIGMKRELNQDYVFTSEIPVGPLANLFMVADGMGGHNAGDYASKHTIGTIVEEIEKSKDTSVVQILEQAIKSANRHIRIKSQENEGLSGMGTTVVAATVMDDKLCVANVGDSRLYVINQEIKQITVDHSYVEEMVRKGEIKRKDARIHPKKNVITRAVGVETEVEADFYEIELTGDAGFLLLCTDGLTNMVEDEEIRHVVMRHEKAPQDAVKELINRANESGGKDNISVVVIQMKQD